MKHTDEGYTGTVAEMSAAIAHDLTSDQRFTDWWDTHGDSLSGFVGLYRLVASLAAAITQADELDEVMIYDLSLGTVNLLLTTDPDTIDGAVLVAGLIADERAEEAKRPYYLWRNEVDFLCRKHLYCSWADLCGDEEPLTNGFECGQTPLDFVIGMERKYDLEWKD